MVDIGVCASGDSTRRKMDSLADCPVEVVPPDLYDSFRAKIDANLQWICAKAYGIDNVPEELKDPFYIDQYEQEHIKPPVIKLLLSSELYCRACSLILKGDQVAALQGHQPVIEALSQKGIYVMESEDMPVSESDLSCAPIKMSAHMSMIDALMMAYTVEMMSIEKVVSSVKRFSTFSASKELPYDLEDAMVFWINKVNMKMREILEKEHRLKQQIIESPSHPKVRYRRDHPSNRQLPYFPLLEELMKDISDGGALLTVIHFYCPELMKLDDICLKEVPSIADSLFNIQLLKEFSNEYLNKCFYLTLEDMLYSSLVLKPNIMVFIAELFWWFENVKPDFVQPRDIQESKEAKAMLPHKNSRPQIPISNATKRSFMASPAGTADSHSLAHNVSDSSSRNCLQPEEVENGKGSTAFSPSHPLLPLRQKQQKPVQADESPSHRDRSNSLTRSDVPPRSSVMAWAEKKPRPLSQPPFALHCADDVDAASGDSISLARSISKDSLASNIISATPKHQPMNSSAHCMTSRSLLGNVDIEDDEEELIAFIKADETSGRADLELQSFSSRASSQPGTARSPGRISADVDGKPESFFLEPLMPAVLKKAKEKQTVPKREEYGEIKRGFASRRQNEVSQSLPRKKITTYHTGRDLNRTFTPVCSTDLPAAESPRLEPPQASLENGSGSFRPLATSSVDPSEQLSGGFFLHDSKEEPVEEEKPEHLLVDEEQDPESTWTVLRNDSDSDHLDLEDCEPDLPPSRPACKYIGEEESAKLQEDMKVREIDDKDDASGRSSPCLSTISQISSVSMASGSIRMTSFAERKFQRLNSYETKSSTSSSQKTTPDGSECGPPPLTTWKQRREQSPGRQSKDHVNVLASELVQLHMQLEEKRRAIEAQKKKMESLSARQRLKLGKAAFLHVVKKGKLDGPSHPLKPEHFPKDYTKQNLEEAEAVASKAEAHLEKTDLESEVSKEAKGQDVYEQKPKKPDLEEGDMCNVIADGTPEEADSEVDVNECNLSIEKLNETISTLQQAILKISQQQELLMKAPASVLPDLKNGTQDQKLKPPVQFMEPLSPTGTGTGPRKRFGQGRNSRLSRAIEHKTTKEKTSRVITPTHSIETLPHLKSAPSLKSPCPPPDIKENGAEQVNGPEDTFRLHEENYQRTFVLSSSKDANILSEQMHRDSGNGIRVACVGSAETSDKENVPMDERLQNKSGLIEVDLSVLKDPEEEDAAEQSEKSSDVISEDQKSGFGFFFKDDQKAEDELAKKRAAFLLKQQKKAEEARLRKLQLETEVELKRDEARRKAEEDRIRKDEEKARRELIKQEYLRRKQQQILEEQGLGRPKPKPKPKKTRPKSVHREESHSDSGTKYSSTPDNLSSAQSGSSLSLASGATTEAESVHSGGTPSHRVDSMEMLSVASRHQSRTTERDWENASTASSVASVAEYSGPKLYKEPSSKSNKPIIHNAIAHCCLAGKVNESQKNSTLDELEKCDSNHYIILFRDAGCQYRSVYSFYPDTEDFCKLTGTGPKIITKKMIDKLYKYSSDRKQFTVIPAKTMSASVDAVTIHNHLWQAKRPALPKKNPLSK